MVTFVAEAGPCNGDLDYALQMVGQLAAVRSPGPHRVAMKVQLYRREQLVVKDAGRYDRTGGDEQTQWDMFARQLTPGQWRTVAEAADGAGLPFFASPFDPDSLALAAEIGDRIKIASGDLTNRPLIEAAAATGLPLVISTGGAQPYEAERAAGWVERVADVTWLACTLAYPAETVDANVGRMSWLRTRLGGKVGYSDHTRGWQAAETACGAGADMIEKHVTLTPGQGGDHDFAATPEQVQSWLRQCDDWRHVPSAAGTDWCVPAEYAGRYGARRAVRAAHDLEAGHVVQPDDVVLLRPGDQSWPPWDLDSLYGRQLSSATRRHQPIL